MRSRLQLPSTSVFAFWLLMPWSCNAGLTYVDDTDVCTTYYAMGQAEFCCNGNCADGTSVDSISGLCQNYDSNCNDPINVPYCAQNQLFYVQGSTVVTVGGNCNQAGTCQWSSFKYKYSCCNCPAGYVSLVPSCAQLDEVGLYFQCVGCSLVSESLTYDSTAGTYSCQPSTVQELCNAVAKASKALTAIGNANSLLGALCPTTKLKAVIVQLSQLALSLADAARDPSNGLGITGTGISRAAALAGAIGTFVSGLGFVAAGITSSAAVAAAVGSAYAVGCDASYLGGVAISGAQAYLELAQPLINSVCPAPNTKRSISESTTSLDLESFKRDASYNPCAELVSYFPTDYTLAAAVDSSCNQLSIYNATVTEDPNVAAAITELQQFCSSYQSSGNTTLLMDFEVVLNATNAFIPYCYTNQTISSSSTSASAQSSSTLLSTSTSSILSTSSNTVASISSSTSVVSSTSVTSTSTVSSSTVSTSSTPSVSLVSSVSVSTVSVSTISVSSVSVSSVSVSSVSTVPLSLTSNPVSEPSIPASSSCNHGVTSNSGAASGAQSSININPGPSQSTLPTPRPFQSTSPAPVPQSQTLESTDSLNNYNNPSGITGQTPTPSSIAGLPNSPTTPLGSQPGNTSPGSTQAQTSPQGDGAGVTSPSPTNFLSSLAIRETASGLLWIASVPVLIAVCL